MLVRQLLIEDAQKFGSKPAIVFRDNPISFEQLKTNVFKLASGLKELGVKKGTKVAIYLPNWPEYIYSYLAVFCLGAVGVPLDLMLKEEELVSCLSHCEADFLIAVSKEEVSLSKIKQNVGSLKNIILISEPQDVMLSFNEIFRKGADNLLEAQIKETDPSLIMYTSGTTGRPKGILLNYRHLDGSPKAMEHFVDLTERDIKLSALPLSHIGGLIYIQNCICFGITLVLMERFIPLEFIRNIEKYKVTCFHIVPSMYLAILALKEMEKFDLTSLRWAVVFGAPSSPEALKRFHQYCPNAHLLNGWGLTETCPPNTVIPLGSNRLESVGKPAPWVEIKILDENNKGLPVGAIGEIAIRGWVVMDGYYKDEEATKEVIHQGWFHTGDLGRFDNDGFLYIMGRKKEMFKVGGQIVYAPEVEAAILKNEKVLEVAIIGIPDKLRGEAVKAFVSLKPNQSLSAEDLRYFCKEHLAHFKVPHEIEFRDNLPKNRTGKIDKELLKEGE